MPSLTRSALALAFATSLQACSDATPVTFSTPDASTDVSSDAATDTALSFDVNGDSRTPDSTATDARFTACEKVDLLFVIDDSGSMADNQRSLAASFDGFMRGVRSRLSSVQSYHIGVVTSENYYANAGGCTEIGDLVTRTAGPGASNMTCGPFASGASYLTQDEPDLAARFRCAAQLGSGGADNERMMRSLLNAVSPRLNAPGACNAGFARRDSLLVVVLITDEDDVEEPCDTPGCTPGGSGGLPDDWVRELVGYRSGLSQNIVVLSLLGQRLDNPCGAQPAARLIGFTRRFGANGFTGDVCASSYDGFFDSTLSVIESACRGYVAPP